MERSALRAPLILRGGTRRPVRFCVHSGHTVARLTSARGCQAQGTDVIGADVTTR